MKERAKNGLRSAIYFVIFIIIAVYVMIKGKGF